MARPLTSLDRMYMEIRRLQKQVEIAEDDFGKLTLTRASYCALWTAEMHLKNCRMRLSKMMDAVFLKSGEFLYFIHDSDFRKEIMSLKEED